MDSGVIESLINLGGTVSVGIIAAVAAYKGTIKGVNTQIAHDKEISESETKRREDTITIAINNFLRNEIVSNFATMNNKVVEEQLAKIFDGPASARHYLFNPSGFVFDEYNQLKYELITYQGDSVLEIIDIYNMFQLLQRKDHLREFSVSEYEEFKRVYNILLEKYRE